MGDLYKRKKLQNGFFAPDTMYTFKLAGDITARIQLETNLSLNDLGTLAAHIPGIVQANVTRQQTKSATDDVVITHIEDETTELKTDHKGRITLTAPWNGKIAPDFVHLFYGAARLAWLNNHLCPVHGACVGLPGKSNVLIVGHPGVGKTSATLSSTLNKNLRMFSGDKTIIDMNSFDHEMRAVGGTPTLTIRQSDIERWQKYNLQFEKQGDRFQGKLPEAYQYNEPSITIHKIVLLNLNDGAQKFQELQGREKLHTLIQYFIDSERSDTYLGDAEAMLNGNISAENKLEIAQKLSASLKNVQVYNVVNSLEGVTDVISELANVVPAAKVARFMGKK